jgi:hypothetical protein
MDIKGDAKYVISSVIAQFVLGCKGKVNEDKLT